MKKYAFTLAEILVVLAVIGVVATLTLPGMLMSYREKTYIAQLQRTYNSLSNAAVAQMVADDVDDLSQSSITTAKGVEDFIKNNLKVEAECGDKPGDCFAETYESTNKTGTFKPLENCNGTRCYLLNTGASICMGPMSSHAAGYSNIVIDTNGTAGPNVNGRDYFGLILKKDGTISGGWVGHKHEYTDCNNSSKMEYGCFNSIIKHGWKMTY